MSGGAYVFHWTSASTAEVYGSNGLIGYLNLPDGTTKDDYPSDLSGYDNDFSGIWDTAFTPATPPAEEIEFEDDVIEGSVPKEPGADNPPKDPDRQDGPKDPSHPDNENPSPSDPQNPNNPAPDDGPADPRDIDDEYPTEDEFPPGPDNGEEPPDDGTGDEGDGSGVEDEEDWQDDFDDWDNEDDEGDDEGDGDGGSNKDDLRQAAEEAQAAANAARELASAFEGEADGVSRAVEEFLNSSEDDANGWGQGVEVPASSVAGEFALPPMPSVQTKAGEPVNPRTGAWTCLHADARLYGADGGLAIERAYSNQSYVRGVFGLGWSSVFDARVRLLQSGSCYVHFGDGTGGFFGAGAGGVYRSPAHCEAELRRSQDGRFRVRLGSDRILVCDAQGLVVRIEDPQGTVTTISRRADGAPTAFADSLGHRFEVTANGKGHITEVRDAVGRRWQYLYDAQDRLIEVQAPRDNAGATARSSSFAYVSNPGDPRLFGAITRLGMASGSPLVENRYAESGVDVNRVLEQIYAGGRWQFGYQHAGTSAGTGDLDRSLTTHVTGPNGARTEFDYANAGVVLEERASVGGETLVTRWAYDDELRPVELHLPGGPHLAYQWATFDDRRNRVSRVTRHDGTGKKRDFSYSYDRLGRVRSATLADGGVVDFDRNTAGQVTRIRAPLAPMAPNGTAARPTTLIEYDSLGRVWRITPPQAAQIEYSYSTGLGRGCSTVKVGTRVVEQAVYDLAGRMISHTDENGRSAAIEWSTTDHVTRELWAHGPERRFGYDTDDNLVFAEDTNLDVNGRPLAPAWIRAEFSYDAWGRCIRDSRPIDSSRKMVQHFEWDAAGKMTAHIDAASLRTEQKYDERGLCVLRIEAKGSPSEIRQTATYDARGNLTSLRDGAGALERYEWDGFDQLVRHRRADSSIAEFFWDTLGRLAEQRLLDPAGVLRAHRKASFDALGRLATAQERIISADGTLGRWLSATTTFDTAGRPVLHSQATGATTRFIWDSKGLLTTIDEGLAHQTRNRYDNKSRLIGVDTVSTGGVVVNSVDFAYDAVGRVSVISDPLGNVERYWYDGFGRVARIQRSDGVEQSYEYHASGALARISLPWAGARATIDYDYDSSGRLNAVTDPDGVTTRLDYDGHSHLASARTGTGANWFQHRYDGCGRVIESTDSRGIVATLQYDGAGRLLSRRWSGPGVVASTANESYEYDPLGRPVRAQNGVHVVESAFDSLGRCEYEAVDARKTEYQYASNLLQVTVRTPGNASISYLHDAHGRLQRSEARIGSGAPLVSTYRWLDHVRLAEEVHGSVKTEYQYDRAGRLVQANATAGTTRIESLTWLRDGSGRPVVRFRRNLDVRTWKRDAAGQLVEERRLTGGAAPSLSPWLPGGAGTQASLDRAIAQWIARAALKRKWDLTPGGDRIRVTRDGATEQYVTGAAHKYTQVGGISIRHDAAANVVRTPRYDLVYDQLSRLIEARDRTTGTATSFTYDALGRVISSTTGSTRSTRTYTGARLIEEIGSPSSSRVWVPGVGPDDPVGFLDSTGQHVLVRDDTWSVVAMLDGTGGVIARYDWDVFGAIEGVLNSQFQQSPMAPRSGALFQGRPLLVDDIRDWRHRALLVELGRFAQRDPILFGDTNPFRFVGNDPLVFVDPDGDIIWIPILVGAAIGGIVAAIANRDKSGWDFALAVGAGVAGGAIGGSGLGVVGMAAGGAVAAGIPAAGDGYRRGGVGGAVTYGLIGAAGGAVAGAVGGSLGARMSTAVAGQVYASLTRGVASKAMTAVGGSLSADASALAAGYAGTLAGGAAGGAMGSLSGGTTTGTLMTLAHGGDIGEALSNGVSSGVAGMSTGALYGAAAGGLSKSLMQSAWYYQTRTLSGVLGAEGEYFVVEQTGNAKANTKLTTGAEPDLWGDALPWRDPVYGDVKNTAKIPSLGKQPSKASDEGQLKQIYDAIPNRFNPQTQPNGNRMTLFYRPGVPTPTRPNHSMWAGLSDGSIQLVPIQQFVLAPWGVGVGHC